MAHFMNPHHFAKLREASRNGDETAVTILAKYRDGADYDEDISNYFNPKTPSSKPAMSSSGLAGNELASSGKPLSGLELFLSQNGITEDSPDYEDTVNLFYDELGIARPQSAEMPVEEPMCLGSVLESLVADELEAIQGYDKAMMFITANGEMKPEEKELLINKMQHIKAEEQEHIAELQEIMKNQK